MYSVNPVLGAIGWTCIAIAVAAILVAVFGNHDLLTLAVVIAWGAGMVGFIRRSKR